MQRYEWREVLDRLRSRGIPSDFKAFMDQIKDKPEIDAEVWAAMYGAVMVDDIGKTMLAAAMQLPLEEAERALDEITRALRRSDFKEGLRRLPRRERRRDMNRRCG
jgi:dsRNA-specific ribonuclease